MFSKRICIIGSGLAGLTAIKSCLEEDLVPVCYECKGNIGGLWRYSEDEIEGLGCVTKSTVINTSKEMSSTSDFVIDENLPNYMHNSKMVEFIESYSNHFNLRKHISFHHKIISVTKAEDYDQTGRWKAVICDLKAEYEFEEVFDGVLVCNGHHAFPMIPQFPGQDQFKGEILHTHGYKYAEKYANQNVVVVGAGNSGMDASVEVSQIAKQAYLSTRSGAWVMPRVGPWGIPLDMLFLTRLFNCFYNILPYSVNCSILEAIANYTFDHKAYGLKPKHRFQDQHPTVHNGLANRLISGTLKLKRNIKEFTEDGVIFDGEATVTPVDTVIMATGYRIHFPFIGKDVIDVKDNKVQLYKFAFPTDLTHPTLAFIGLFQTLGPGIPPMELQTRWVTRVFSEKCKLPKPEFMKRATEESFQKLYKRFGGSPCHTIHVDVINYMDDIASMIGVKPNMFKLMLTDPKLFCYCFFGPCLPYQYRLVGPGSWKGARKAILTYKQRINKPLNNNNKCIETSLITDVIRIFLFTIIILVLSVQSVF